MGYAIGAFVLLKAPKGIAWRPARRTHEDVSKRSREKARRGAAAGGRATGILETRGGTRVRARVRAAPFPEPMPRGDLTPSALRRHDGSNRALPILLAAKGVVYDVTRGRDFYGAGGAYNLFTG